MSAPRDFWSRRRAAVAAEQEAERAAVAERAEAGTRTDLEEKSDAEILEELGLPDPDLLQPGDDVAGFMARTVPDRLRRRALRQLWKLNPVLANVDGLVDYGEDFTDSATVVENLQTAYQVGKGMLAHVEELARQAEAKRVAAGNTAGDTAGDAAGVSAGPDAAPDSAALPPEATPQEAPDLPLGAAEETDPNSRDTTKVAVVTPRDSAQTETDMSASAEAAFPRRMRFNFEG